MQIVFKLPQGCGGMAAGYRGHHLRKRLTEFGKKYNTDVKINTQGYRLIVTIEDKFFTVFALTWTIASTWDQFEVL